MSPEWAIVLAAALASLGPSIAAAGAWRNSRATSRAINNRPAEAPTVSDDVAAIRIGVASLHDEHRRLAERLDRHVREGHPRRRGW